jgi:hypothetical protein
MLILKSCPRCRRGDVVVDQEEGLYCLQCGHELRPNEQTVVLARQQPRFWLVKAA